MTETPLLAAECVSCRFASVTACREVSVAVHAGEILGIVGESGAGKSTLLRCLAGALKPASGRVIYTDPAGRDHQLHALDDSALRRLARSQWGFVHQNPHDGLRPHLSAGANVVETLLRGGETHYARARAAACHWLAQVELDRDRIDDRVRTFSGGMQQRVQLARNLVNEPRLLFLDEPTGGLDVSVQARLLDLIRQLAAQLQVAVVLVTHDLAAVRLLAHRIMVMQQGDVVEQGLTDQVLDDPQDAYSQLLVASELRC